MRGRVRFKDLFYGRIVYYSLPGICPTMVRVVGRPSYKGGGWFCPIYFFEGFTVQIPLFSLGVYDVSHNPSKNRSCGRLFVKRKQANRWSSISKTDFGIKRQIDQDNKKMLYPVFDDKPYFCEPQYIFDIK